MDIVDSLIMFLQLSNDKKSCDNAAPLCAWLQR